MRKTNVKHISLYKTLASNKKRGYARISISSFSIKIGRVTTFSYP